MEIDDANIADDLKMSIEVVNSDRLKIKIETDDPAYFGSHDVHIKARTSDQSPGVQNSEVYSFKIDMKALGSTGTNTPPSFS